MFYIFSEYVFGIPVYERSTPYEWRAKERVEELKAISDECKDAFYTTELPEEFYS